MNRVDVIQRFIDFLDAETYLEIGVRNGESFLPIQCKNKIGVDIRFPHIFPKIFGIFYEMSSNTYFDLHPFSFDVAFIDGDHTFEQSLKDAMNCLKWMNPKGVILLHDCNPTKPEWATSEYIEASPNWCGEVWKTILALRTNPNLYVFVLDVDYGIGVVRNGHQEPLPYSIEQIKRMTYKDLEKNRNAFLNLGKGVL